MGNPPPSVQTRAVEVEMKYCIYKDAKGEWRWRLRAKNGEIIADSGEGYTSKANCEAAIKLVKGSGDAPTEDDC
jgi:uncharacterized protein